MVKLVPEVTEGYDILSLNGQVRVAGVRGNGRQGGEVSVKEQMDWMRRNHQMDGEGTEVKQMFDGVHRKPRPRTDTDVAVVGCVRDFEQRWPMQQSVHHVKMKRLPKDDEREQRHEPHGVGIPISPHQKIVGEHPHQQDLKYRPDSDATDTGVEDIVPSLIAAEIPIVIFAVFARVDSFLVSLSFKGVEVQMQ